MYYLNVLLFVVVTFLLILSSSVFADSIFIKSDASVIKISGDDNYENFFEDKKFFRDNNEENDNEDKKHYIKRSIEAIKRESCGLNIKDKDIKNSVIKNKVIINNKKVNESCFKNGSSSVNLGISIESGTKIKNSVIKNESVIKNSKVIINGKKIE